MIASAPSKIAVATSDTSARVGTGLEIIDSSICVATTTGLPARRAARVICFWMPGTFSSGISTPRSPRATIIASVRSMISSSRCTACGFSILAITAARPRRDLLRLGDVLRALDERQRHPVDAGVERGVEIGAVLRRQRARTGSAVSGRLTPLRSESLPPTSTLRDDAFLRLASVTLSRILPSSSSSVWPGSSRRRSPDAADARASRRRAPDRRRA